LNELLLLQLTAEHPNGHNLSGCKVFGSYWNQEKKTILGGGVDTNTVKEYTNMLTFVNKN